MSADYEDGTHCNRCGAPLTLRDGDAPRFLHPSGEAICPVDNEDGEQDSGEPVPSAPAHPVGCTCHLEA